MHVRLARLSDLGALVSLSQLETGLTTLPTTEEGMRRKVMSSVDSTDPNRCLDGQESYLFVLESEGEILGLSAIYATAGAQRPFYNYRVSTISQQSPELDVRVDTRLLTMVNDYGNSSLVGTLFVHPDARGTGGGRLLSLARFMFMAAHRNRFSDFVLAEMRGRTRDDGASPFWEAVGRKFLQLDFTDADVRSGHESRFIADLFPSFPIYADLLPKDAQDVIGLPHPEAVPAAGLLRQQGFRHRGYVDIFDAGPCLDACVDDVEIIRSTQEAAIGTPTAASLQAPERVLIARPTLQTFVAAYGTRSDTSVCSTDSSTMSSAGLDDGDPILVSPLQQRSAA